MLGVFLGYFSMPVRVNLWKELQASRRWVWMDTGLQQIKRRRWNGSRNIFFRNWKLLSQSKLTKSQFFLGQKNCTFASVKYCVSYQNVEAGDKYMASSQLTLYYNYFNLKSEYSTSQCLRYLFGIWGLRWCLDTRWNLSITNIFFSPCLLLLPFLHSRHQITRTDHLLVLLFHLKVSFRL